MIDSDVDEKGYQEAARSGAMGPEAQLAQAERDAAPTIEALEAALTRERFAVSALVNERDGVQRRLLELERAVLDVTPSLEGPPEDRVRAMAVALQASADVGVDLVRDRERLEADVARLGFAVRELDEGKKRQRKDLRANADHWQSVAESLDKRTRLAEERAATAERRCQVLLARAIDPPVMLVPAPDPLVLDLDGVPHVPERKAPLLARLFAGATVRRAAELEVRLEQEVARRVELERALAGKERLVEGLNRSLESTGQYAEKLQADLAALRAARVGTGPVVDKLKARLESAHHALGAHADRRFRELQATLASLPPSVPDAVEVDLDAILEDANAPAKEGGAA